MSEETTNIAVIEKPQRFQNPYNDLPKSEKKQVVVDISKTDGDLVKCTRPGWGTISTVTGFLWLSFAKALRERGITEVSKETELENFVKDCVIIPREEYEALKVDSAKLQKSLIKRTKKGSEVQGDT